MKKYLKLLIMCLCAMVFTTARVSAEEFFASDFAGANIQDKIVTVTDTEAEILYEWFTEESGSYSVSFSNAVSNNCAITASINGGYPVKIADITKSLTLGFDSGINSIKLSVTKNNASATFSVGTITLSRIGELSTGSIHIEASKTSCTYVTSGLYYYENYGSDMSNNDVLLLQQGSMPEVVFAVYAPVSGEYSMTSVMSFLGQRYTSDINMIINGEIHPLTATTMNKTADLTNASDAGLMKRYKKRSTVVLRQGMNTISFSAIEKRENNNDLYLFFLDCVDFTFVNAPVEITADITAAGEYTYPVYPSYTDKYELEIEMVSQELLLKALPECSISVNGTNYTQLVKGETVKVISEYSDNGYLYGTYQLTNNVTVTDKLYLKVGDGCTIKNISLIPVISGLKEISAKAQRVILVPGESTDISVFAVDEKGYALNLDRLRENDGVTFKSSDRDILAVDASGCVTALKPGIAHIIVAASDGENTKLYNVKMNVYNEKYGFTILSAEKDEEFVKVRLLSPFGTRESGHVMAMAEYLSDVMQLQYLTLHDVNNLAKGQIITYKMPSSKNLFKIISLNSLHDLIPVYEAITIKEG